MLGACLLSICLTIYPPLYPTILSFHLQKQSHQEDRTQAGHNPGPRSKCHRVPASVASAAGASAHPPASSPRHCIIPSFLRLVLLHSPSLERVTARRRRRRRRVTDASCAAGSRLTSAHSPLAGAGAGEPNTCARVTGVPLTLASEATLAAPRSLSLGEHEGLLAYFPVHSLTAKCLSQRDPLTFDLDLSGRGRRTGARERGREQGKLWQPPRPGPVPFPLPLPLLGMCPDYPLAGQGPTPCTHPATPGGMPSALRMAPSLREGATPLAGPSPPRAGWPAVYLMSGKLVPAPSPSAQIQLTSLLFTPPPSQGSRHPAP